MTYERKQAWSVAPRPNGSLQLRVTETRRYSGEIGFSRPLVTYWNLDDRLHVLQLARWLAIRNVDDYDRMCAAVRAVDAEINEYLNIPKGES